MNQWFQVRTLSPVHVGSGEEWVRGTDYFSASGRTWFVSPERVGDAFADEIARGESIERIVGRRRIDPQQVSSSSCTGFIEASKLRLAVRAGDGRPLLPGSSLKGALRTLLLVAWTADEPHGRRRSALATPWRESLNQLRARDIEGAVFCAPELREPKGDILRGLKVGDAHFAVESVEVRSAKAIGTKRNTLNAVEVLPSDARSALRLTLERPGALPGLAFPQQLPGLAQLSVWSKQHAAHLLRGDRDYFRRNDVAALTDRCDRLLKTVDALGPQAIVLRLGWGIGWTGMTGDILDERERSQLRMRLGKTRKVALSGHSERSEPTDLFGWIVLEPVDAAAARTLMPDAPRPAPVAAPLVAERPSAPVVDLDEVFLNRLRRFQARDFGQLNQLVGEAERHAKREAALAALGERLAGIFDRKKLKEIGTKFAVLKPFLKKADG